MPFQGRWRNWAGIQSMIQSKWFAAVLKQLSDGNKHCPRAIRCFTRTWLV